MKHYTVLKQLSEIAETFSIVYVTVFRLFIYLMYENTETTELPRR